MARTTITAVKDIINTSLDDSVIASYIDMANRMVTEVLSDDTSLSSAILTDIECWLTAHLIEVTRERRAQREQIGDASITYTGVFGSGLNATPYGQTVKLLDTTGKMSRIGKIAASIRAVQSFE